MYQIGSVVELASNDGNKMIPIIVIGRLMQQTNGQVSDYIGMPYPYGFTGSNSFISFDEKHIINVLFDGFKTEMSNELQQFYQEKYEESQMLT